MQKEVLQYIKNKYTLGVDFNMVAECSTCVEIINQDILNDPIVAEYLTRTSKNN